MKQGCYSIAAAEGRVRLITLIPSVVVVMLEVPHLLLRQEGDEQRNVDYNIKYNSAVFESTQKNIVAG